MKYGQCSIQIVVLHITLQVLRFICFQRKHLTSKLHFKNIVQKAPKKNRESNGVIFDGKIANIDWMGHFLYGMIRTEIQLTEEWANWGHGVLQSVTNSNLALVKEGELARKPEDENLAHQIASDMGHAYQQKNKIHPKHKMVWD